MRASRFDQKAWWGKWVPRSQMSCSTAGDYCLRQYKETQLNQTTGELTGTPSIPWKSADQLQDSYGHNRHIVSGAVNILFTMRFVDATRYSKL